jgi:pimeloyl-ACP methyl ester carboxylesterase
MPYVENQGVRIHYRAEGGGPPLVLQHGSSMKSSLWDACGYVDALNADYRLVLIDARGHGESDKPHDRAAYRWPISVTDVLAVLDAIDSPQAIYWGYSWGGALGFALAKQAPDRIAALIVGGSMPKPRTSVRGCVASMVAIPKHSWSPMRRTYSASACRNKRAPGSWRATRRRSRLLCRIDRRMKTSCRI